MGRRFNHNGGFTLLELLVVVVLIALIFSAVLPISYGMVSRYRASLRAQEVMLYVSGLRRNAFLYSEKHLLSSRNSRLTVDGSELSFGEARISVAAPIFFYGNGTTSGGRIEMTVEDESYRLDVAAPLGSLSLTPGEKGA